MVKKLTNPKDKKSKANARKPNIPEENDEEENIEEQDEIEEENEEENEEEEDMGDFIDNEDVEEYNGNDRYLYRDEKLFIERDKKEALKKKKRRRGRTK